MVSKHARQWNDESATTKAVSEFASDYDRILYSTAFRRLGGVTQVVASNEVALFHNRLTHSLKTAQVGGRLTTHLLETHDTPAWHGVIEENGGLDRQVVVAACMAHDLGHPPFGHIAEKELQYLTSAEPNTTHRRRNQPVAISRSPAVGAEYALKDRFEGNAQSFRIVTKLAFRESYHDDPARCPALDLTRGVLAAMLKYPWGFEGRPTGIKVAPGSMKWGFYESERGIARWVFDGKDHPRRRTVDLPGRREEYRTLEAQVMDWADDISYAVHDVEDFFRAGIIPLDLLFSSENEWNAFFGYAWKGGVEEIVDCSRADVERLLDDVRKKSFPRTPYIGSRSDREGLHAFAAELIRAATAGTRLRADGIVLVDPEQLAIVEVLKELTWYYVIDRPSLESTQRGQRNIIRSLFRSLIEWIEEVWQGPRSMVDGAASNLYEPLPAGARLSRRELPARLIDYLEVAFSTDEITGCGDGYPENQKLARAAIDYIVSLTEVQAMELNSRLTGESVQSMLDGWFHF